MEEYHRGSNSRPQYSHIEDSHSKRPDRRLPESFAENHQKVQQKIFRRSNRKPKEGLMQQSLQKSFRRFYAKPGLIKDLKQVKKIKQDLLKTKSSYRRPPEGLKNTQEVQLNTCRRVYKNPPEGLIEVLQTTSRRFYKIPKQNASGRSYRRSVYCLIEDLHTVLQKIFIRSYRRSAYGLIEDLHMVLQKTPECLIQHKTLRWSHSIPTEGLIGDHQIVLKKISSRSRRFYRRS